MNLILIDSDQVRGHTDLKDVFKPFRDEVSNYNWLITDFEVYPCEIFNGSSVWITGKELLELVENNNIQFIWGVISAFYNNIKLDVDKMLFKPIAEGNKQLWSNNPKIQQENASIEIICWDSTATILMSRDNNIANQYQRYYSDAQDLNEYNRRINYQRDFIKDTLLEYIQDNLNNMREKTYVSKGYKYDIDRNIEMIISNLRYQLYKKNYDIVPVGKDVNKIIELFTNAII